MNKAFIIILGVALIAGAVYILLSRQSSEPSLPEPTIPPTISDANPTTTEQIPQTTTQAGTYTLEEVAKHATPQDCWFAINGTVYNVTEFVKDGKHPGGEALLQGCGKDATVLFTTRPMGSGTEHSEKAYAFLETYKIGALQQ